MLDNLIVVSYVDCWYTKTDSGQLEISVTFTSPVSYATERFVEQSEDHVVPPACVPEQFKVFLSPILQYLMPLCYHTNFL